MSEDLDVELHEPKRHRWEDALEAFLAAGFRPGNLIPHEWFYAALGIKQPTKDMPYGEGKRLELCQFPEMISLRKALLTGHEICLRPVIGKGYVWLLPGEQAERCTEDLIKDVRKRLERGMQEVSHVDKNALTLAEKSQQRNLMNHIASMRSSNHGMIRHGRKLLRQARLHQEPEQGDQTKTA